MKNFFGKNRNVVENSTIGQKSNFRNLSKKITNKNGSKRDTLLKTLPVICSRKVATATSRLALEDSPPPIGTVDPTTKSQPGISAPI